MKKPIFVATCVLMLIALSSFFISREKKCERLLIQTEFFPKNDVTGIKINQPGKNKTVWVQANTKFTKNISFYTSAVTITKVISKLNAINKNYSDRKSITGKHLGIKWIVETNETTTFLKLIHPEQALNKVTQRSGC